MDPNQSDECPECPLCMELLEMDDIKFFPCTCGYQICRFCWHRLRTDENGLCPACRKPYTECPADYKPLTQEELLKIKQEKKQKELMRKQKVTENRKHLANVRVVQKNLVFVVGLSSRLADAEALKKMEYFGKFGKIHKVVINHTTSYAGSQGPSASAYVTYQRAEDALKAISQVNNIHVDGRTLKVSLGTTKYCSHFMKNQQCPKNDCMYLHELGDEAASFTKEEMQQGKHQEFEKKLQELYLGTGSIKNGSSGVGSSSGYEPPHSSGRRTHKDSLSETSNSGGGNTANSRNSNGRSSVTTNGSCTNNNNNSNNCSNGGSAGGGGYHTAGIQPLDSIVINPSEGWPSLHLVGTKELGSSNSSNNGGSSSSGVSSASGSQSSVNSSTSIGSNQSKKNRKHNSSNGNVTNGSNCASSPRNTPTREHQNSNRRARNDDSTSSSSGRSTAARVSPSPNCAASSEVPTSLSFTLSTSPPTSSPPETTPSKHKHTSRSPVSSADKIRNKSLSPNRNSESQLGSNASNSCDTYNSDVTHSTTSNQIDSLRSAKSEETEGNVLDEKYIELEKDSLRIEDLSTEKNEESKETSGVESGDSSYPTSEANTDPFYANIVTSLNDVVDSQDVTQNLHVSSIRTDDWEVGEVSQQTDSEEVVLPAPNIWSNVVEEPKSIDDELGFDPFEETNKALAQDIMIEKEKEQQQRHQLHQQRQQQQSFHQIQLQQQQAEPPTGLKAFIGTGSGSISAVNAARLPPPGFNGVTSLHNVSSNISHNGVDVAKLLPLLSSINSSLGNSVSTPPPQINGLINRVATGPPPGLGLLNSISSHQQGVSNSTAGVSGVSSSALLSGIDTSAHTLAPPQPGPPPGLSLPKQDPFAMKDLENVFPSMTSLNRMNSLNTLNSSTNSLNPSISSFCNMNGLTSLNPLSLSSLGNGSGSALNFRGVNSPQQQATLNHLNAFSGVNLASAQQQVSGNNVISNLFSFNQQQQHQQPLQQQSQQQQQQQSQQQPQQQQQLPQPSVLHQLALHSAQKGWSGNSNGAPDLTALDPAIVSSGQLTDSRSDSPPEWLRLMEAPASTWSTLLPSHTSNNATVPQHHPSSANLQTQAPLSSHQQVSLLQQQHHQQQLAALQQQQQLRQQQAVPSVWPPTSPPPGFSSLSPLHRAKLPHKIDNL